MILGHSTFIALYDKGYHTGSPAGLADAEKFHVDLLYNYAKSATPAVVESATSTVRVSERP